MLSRLPLNAQLTELEVVLRQNRHIPEVLGRLASLRLPGWYLTAGCLFQTIWNVQTGRAADAGIKDYDIFYFDDSDLSWQAENAVIEEIAALFADLDIEVEVRNEARVHLWYEQKFGVPLAPLSSAEEAIDNFAATTCCLGVRSDRDDVWQVYAPHGLSDIFNLVIRPNPVLAPESVYRAKTARWLEEWPQLTVMAWPRPESYTRSMEYQLRQATPADAEAVVLMHTQVHEQCYGHVLSEEFFAARRRSVPERTEQRRVGLDTTDPRIIALDADQRIIGFADAGPARDEELAGELELYSIYVLEEAHGTGLGKALLDAAIGQQAAYLWVLQDNPRAQAFYRKNGFQPDGAAATLPESWASLPEIRMHRSQQA
ncbi:nucleotidyltransferase family protein [Psychromicrobium lacuslunae]|uniref:nucleotidyltransferase family protein n=1 Tax=Psychromicrobium lacuslunae TaxID=1618207 RepID=UPI000A4D545A|nr:nucleotidyltransferase family protein [Psychromicrobium lacuslunae]